MKNSILHRFACIIAASTIAGEMALAIAAPIILDLSKDLVESPSINKSPSAVNILEFIKGTPNARTLMVIDDGQVVISYARDDVDPNEPYQVHSVTKSVTSLLIGVLVDAGDLSVNDTLGQIFTNETTWEGVEDVEFRKEMLTMTSGLRYSNSDLLADFVDGLDYCSNVTNQVGYLFRESLGDPTIGTRGQFDYLVINDILSYTILEKTGLTPRELLASKVLPNIGIEDNEINWTADIESFCPGYTPVPGTPEPAFHGLYLTSAQMAKIGMLYLQNGMTGPDTAVVSPGWVDETLTSHVFIGENFAYDTPNPFGEAIPYGYLWYNIGSHWSAQGYGGQVISIDPLLRRVFLYQHDDDVPGGEMEAFNLEVMALDPSVSYEAPSIGVSSGQQFPCLIQLSCLVTILLLPLTLLWL